jgi:phosphopantetheinyl transferase
VLALAERALGAGAAQSLRAAAPEARTLLFHRAWARHEARLKCSGLGIWSAPTPGPVHMTELDAGAAYAAALAVEGADPVTVRTYLF